MNKKRRLTCLIIAIYVVFDASANQDKILDFQGGNIISAINDRIINIAQECVSVGLKKLNIQNVIDFSKTKGILPSLRDFSSSLSQWSVSSVVAAPSNERNIIHAIQKHTITPNKVLEIVLENKSGYNGETVDLDKVTVDGAYEANLIDFGKYALQNESLRDAALNCSNNATFVALCLYDMLCNCKSVYLTPYEHIVRQTQEHILCFGIGLSIEGGISLAKEKSKPLLFIPTHLPISVVDGRIGEFFDNAVTLASMYPLFEYEFIEKGKGGFCSQEIYPVLKIENKFTALSNLYNQYKKKEQLKLSAGVDEVKRLKNEVIKIDKDIELITRENGNLNGVEDKLFGIMQEIGNYKNTVSDIISEIKKTEALIKQEEDKAKIKQKKLERLQKEQEAVKKKEAYEKKRKELEEKKRLELAQKELERKKNAELENKNKKSKCSPNKGSDEDLYKDLENFKLNAAIPPKQMQQNILQKDMDMFLNLKSSANLLVESYNKLFQNVGSGVFENIQGVLFVLTSSIEYAEASDMKNLSIWIKDFESALKATKTCIQPTPFTDDSVLSWSKFVKRSENFLAKVLSGNVVIEFLNKIRKEFDDILISLEKIKSHTNKEEAEALEVAYISKVSKSNLALAETLVDNCQNKNALFIVRYDKGKLAGKGVYNSLLSNAIMENNIAFVKFLLDNKIFSDWNNIDRENILSPLEACIYTANTKLLERIIKNIAPSVVNTKKLGVSGEKAIGLASLMPGHDRDTMVSIIMNA